MAECLSSDYLVWFPAPDLTTMLAPDLMAALASGEPVSGSALAAQGGISRTAIWKQVELLRARGLPVQSQGGAGYQLPWPIQPLDAAAIRAALSPQAASRLGGLEVIWEVDSTSSELQRRGSTVADGSVVMAETQSAGRGRRGRPWLSPPGINIYLSCLKRFERGFAALSGLSLAVGVMVLRALRTAGIEGAGLKWPNDVLGPQGKLAGILVELGGEYQGPCAAVIGVGLNLRLTDALRAQAAQPIEDLAALGGGSPPDRNVMAGRLISALLEGLTQFEHEGFAGFRDDYASFDLLRHRQLHLSGAMGDFDGMAEGVDERGALRVRVGDECRLIDSGDVTVRRL